MRAAIARFLVEMFERALLASPHAVMREIGVQLVKGRRG